MKWAWTALAAAGLATGVPDAHGAENLACMDAPFAAEDQQLFDSFYGSFDLDGFENSGPAPELLMILTVRAGECAEASNWSPEAIEAATLYRLGKVLEDALVTSSSFTPTQWTRLKSAYASADKAILNRLFGPMIDAELGGAKAPEPSEADKLYLGRLMLRTGIPTTEANSEFVGAWMAAKALQENFGSQFAKF